MNLIFNYKIKNQIHVPYVMVIIILENLPSKLAQDVKLLTPTYAQHRT
jgi:hypothetical protein